MSKQIERILLIILWLLAATLGASFWFNSIFGFNIFSAGHWEYISYLQAARQTIRPAFYISMITASAIALGGLYILMRPQLRNLHLPKIKISFSRNKKLTAAASSDTTIQNREESQKTQHEIAQPIRQSATLTTATNTTVAQTATAGHDTAARDAHIAQAAQAAPVAPRPPRLSIPRTATQPTAAPVTPAPKAATPTVSEAQIKEIQQIFQDAGYTTKPPHKIAGLNDALIAIGTDEQLWLGGIDTTPATVSAAMEKLSNIFTDTLEDIEITINGFIVGSVPSDENTTNIQIFADTNALGRYMADNANPPLPEDDNGNFDAYSEYIDTVLNYVGKI